MNILVAATLGTIEKHIKKILENFQNYEGIYARNEEEVWDIINEQNPSFVMLEGVLWENLTGYELCKKIKKFGQIPIMLFSSGDNEEQAYKSGADSFLKIPFEVSSFKEALEKILSQKKKILTVDDSSMIRKILYKALTEHGYDVIQAEDGKLGLQKLEEERPDLIISDVEMPNMDGYEFCKAVKSNPKFADIPIIISSTLSSGFFIDRGFDAGADDYLPKPIVPEELTSRIHSLLAGETLSGRENILVVDSKSFSVNMMKHILSGQGFELSSATSLNEGVQQMIRDKPDIVVISNEFLDDIGYLLLQKIRKEKSMEDIGIVILTDREIKRERAKYQKIGVDTFLSKPFSNDKLIAVIEKVVAFRKIKKSEDVMKLYMSEAAYSTVKQLSADKFSLNELRAEERDMSIFFTDIVGFTPMCEDLSPREIVGLLNEFFDTMVHIVKKNNGMVDKFVGDAMLALFDPLVDKHFAYQACKTGLEMQTALKKFNYDRAIDLKIRIGINTGMVIWGDMGSRLYRRDTTVIGDNVNIAQRLESKCPHGKVLISESTYEHVKDQFSVEQKIENLALKGKSSEFCGYVIGNK